MLLSLPKSLHMHTIAAGQQDFTLECMQQKNNLQFTFHIQNKSFVALYMMQQEV